MFEYTKILQQHLEATQQKYQQQNEEFKRIMALNDSILDAQNTAMEQLNDRSCFEQLADVIDNI